MKETKISIPTLHSGQDIVIAGRKRFNVLCNGRRWGKTTLAVDLLIDTILDGYPCAYFSPTYEMAEDLWEDIKDRTESITKYKNESKMTLRFITGGSFKVWSLEKKRAGRGRKYKRVIIDEAAFAKDLKESWLRTIRPTLADYRGDAYFMSTPQGVYNYFYEIFENDKKYSNWASFKMPTTTNPIISKDEIEEIKSQVDSLTFLQEFDAEFVDFNSRPFAYAFDESKQVSPCKYNPNDITRFIFDFNVSPATCAVTQHGPGYKHIIDEFHLETASIYQLCDAIKASPYYNKALIRVAGDASGWNREKATMGLDSMYTIICREFGISERLVDSPASNPPVATTRVLLNSILEKDPTFKIDPRCKNIIKDLKLVSVDDAGDINKKNSKLTHHIDTVRYFLSTYHGNLLKALSR